MIKKISALLFAGVLTMAVAGCGSGGSGDGAGNGKFALEELAVVRS